MKTEKAEQEIKKLFDSGLYFKYEFSYMCMNKYMFAINEKNYSLKDIISRLKPNEKIIFMLNNGETWNGEYDSSKCKFFYDEKYDGSIYWNHVIYGDRVRIDSDQGSIKELVMEAEKKFTVNMKEESKNINNSNETDEIKNYQINDLSWMWHCSENPKNILDYSELVTDHRITQALTIAASMGFRTALRKLEELNLIQMSDIDRVPNSNDQEIWDNHFNKK